MINVILTHDVDRIRKTYQYFTHPIKVLRKEGFVEFVKHILSSFSQRKPYWGFNVVLDIETKYNVKSTFFFLNETIKPSLNPKSWLLSLGRYKIIEKKVVDIIKYLDKNGWEVGVHGSYDSFQNKDLLKSEKETLEKIVGHSVKGIRQHWLNLNEQTWQLQKRAGFKYDSSFGFNKCSGFKEDRYKPFYPINGDNSFIEFPMVIMDTPFFNEKNRWELFEKYAAIADMHNSYLIINFHTNNFSELDFPLYKSTYIELIEKLKEKNACFMTMEEAYKLETGK